jgi:tRNA(adenine34) deaminase
MNSHDNDEHWMCHALTLAQQAFDAGEVPVGAVVVGTNDAGEDVVLGEGWNQPIGSHDPSAHAEMMAIRQAALALQNYRMPGARLYVTLEPCTMCAGLLVHARISELIIGTREPKAGAVLSQNQLLQHPAMNWQIAVREGVLADECARMLQDFFAQRRQQQRESRGLS